MYRDEIIQFIPELEGQISDEVNWIGISGITSPEDDTFCFLKDKKSQKKLGLLSSADQYKKTRLIIEKKYHDKLSGEDKSELEDKFFDVHWCEDVMLSMAKLSKPFYLNKFSELNHEKDGRELGTAIIDPTALIADNVFIGDRVVVKGKARIHSGATVMAGSTVGENTELFPQVVIYPWCELGKNIRIHSNTTIGADGFGYHFHNGVHEKIWHSGGVQIGDGVEIGANTSIDQGTFAPTVIGPGCIIDSDVQIGHNCQFGRGVVACGQVGFGGSAIIGDYCVIGGKAGIGNDVSVGKGSQIAGNAMVNTSWPEGSVLGGHPARPLKEWMRGLATLKKLAEKK